jgi:hypothetical protein
VTEVRLQRPRVVPPVCKRVPARMTQHVRVRLDRNRMGAGPALLGPRDGSIDHAREASGGEWGAALRCEHEGRLRFLIALEPPQGAQFVAKDRMGAGPALLGPRDVESGRSEVDLCSTRWSSARRLGDPTHQQSKQLDLLLMSAPSR